MRLERSREIAGREVESDGCGYLHSRKDVHNDVYTIPTRNSSWISHNRRGGSTDSEMAFAYATTDDSTGFRREIGGFGGLLTERGISTPLRVSRQNRRDLASYLDDWQAPNRMFFSGSNFNEGATRH